MAWYYDALKDYTAHEEYKVLAWRWTPDNAFDFDKWAKEHDIEYIHTYALGLTGSVDLLTFSNRLRSLRLVEDENVLVYMPWLVEDKCFPFVVENIEDFHKEYLWHEEANKYWEWNEDGIATFKQWAETNSVQYRRVTWDKENNVELLSFPEYKDKYGTTLGFFIDEKNVLYYYEDRKKKGEIPFDVKTKENLDD